MSQSSIAANRFGYGLRRGEAGVGDAKGWLAGQYRLFQPRPAAFANISSRAEIATTLADFLEGARAMRQERKGSAEKADKSDEMEARRLARGAERDYYTSLVGARFDAAVASDTPFVERLVHFWANHFAVSADKLAVVGMSGMLEVEAVRPNVLGRFSDMLLAVEQHPAMLLYLDQAQSIGPNSPVGSRIAARGGKRGGLNENLAREILELHTLGVRSVYTQADVTEFARALTGWTVSGIIRGPVARLVGGERRPGDFAFANPIHEPGVRTLIGKRYAENGEEQARAMLNDLARHPATARHIATKLARHFAGDDPPAALISRLEKRFLDSGGDLKSVYDSLVEAPEVWAKPQAKFKTPWDWLVSAHRALNLPALPPRQTAQLLTQLGQAVWRPGSPAGYDDLAASWAGPDALFRRVEVAERLATRAGTTTDARTLAAQLFPGALSEATATSLARAESPVQATALLLVSPEFMRR